MAITARKERRRYVRHPIILPARLQSEILPPTPCRIRDYSPGGLLILLQPSQSWPPDLQNHPLTISFNCEAGGAVQLFEVMATVVRLFEGGMGVCFRNLPGPALAAMEAEYRRQQSSHSAASPAVKTLFASDKDRDSCRELIDRQLAKLIEDLYQHLDNEADELPLLGNQALYDELAANRLLRNQRRVFSQYLVDSMQQGISSFCKKPAQQPGVSRAQELALIDNEEFEDWLDLSTVIHKVESSHKNHLDLIHHQLGSLTHLPPTEIYNPVSPERICEHFHDALEQIDTPLGARHNIYQAFESALQKNLADFYQQFQQLLVRRIGAPARLDSLLPSQPDTRQPPAPASAGISAPETPPVSSSPPSMGDIAKQLHALSHSITRAAQTGSGQPAPPSEPAPSAIGEFERGDILAAIAEIQQRQEDADSVLQPQQIQQWLAQASPEPKRIKAEHQRGLEVSCALFDALLNKALVAPALRQYFEALQWPLLKLALIEPDFLDQPDHPARQILDLLGQLNLVGDSRGMMRDPVLQRKLDQLLQRIREQYPENPTILGTCSHELERLLAPLLHNKEHAVQRIVATYEGQQKKRQAKQSVRREIERRLAGKQVPRVLIALLSAGWHHFLVLAALREGLESPAWKRGLEVIDQLMAWLPAGASAPNCTPTEARELVTYVKTQLTSSSPDSYRNAALLHKLVGVLIGYGQPPSRNPLHHVLVKAERSHTEPKPLTAEQSAVLQALEVGNWMIMTPPETEPETVKLIWIGQHPPLYLFAGRNGAKRFELTATELATRLQNGTAKPCDSLDTPLLERASDAILQDLHAQLNHAISHDPVTGLPNRREFSRRLREFTSADTAAALLCYLEIDQVRLVNTSCGHAAGDALLTAIGERLRENFASLELLARLGDSSFALFLRQDSDPALTATDLIAAITHFHFRWQDRSFSLSANLGLVPILPPCADSDELMQQADSACLAAKRSGANHFQIFEEQNLQLKAQKNLFEWAGRIDTLLTENRFFLRCQRIAPVNPEPAHKAHYEVLLGAIDEQGGILPPDNFIPAAEHFKRMSEIDRWVVRQAFQWLLQHPEQQAEIDGFSINLSGQSINQEFLAFIQDQFHSTGIKPGLINFEITETAAIGNLEQADRFIEAIRQIGCQFSLDDFGTGLSSYAYLKNLKVDYLKIDGTFIKNLANDSTDYAMVKSMNEIGHYLGMKTIAEYVENTEILAILREIGVDFAQGYGIGKPMRLAELADPAG